MRNLGVVLVILVVVALLMRTLSKPPFNGELTIPKENWSSVSLYPGAPNTDIIAELKDPEKVAAVVRFVDAHRTGWSHARPEILASAAPDNYLRLDAEKQNATFYLFLWGEGMRVSFYDPNQSSYYRDFNQSEKTELLSLFGQKWSENHRVEAK